jgi:hypothetical protein
LLLFALLVAAEFRCKLLLIKDKRVKGIEPSCRAWEARVLPLNYTRVGKISQNNLGRGGPGREMVGNDCSASLGRCNSEQWT